MSETATERRGLIYDLDETEYHADPHSLSVSGAKLLLKAPALYRHQQDNPVHRDVFDIGSAAHKMVLGVGAEIECVDADSWRTKAAQGARDHARQQGRIPLLVADVIRVRDMADALANHATASTLLTKGQPEVSAFAPDERTGVLRRARFDYLRDDLIVDYKSAATSEPGAFARAAATFGYHQQHAWYVDVAAALHHDVAGFVFIAQAKESPYLVSVTELVPSAVDRGRDLNDRALEMFRDCRAADLWPGYPTAITPIDIPRWAYYDQEIQS